MINENISDIEFAEFLKQEVLASVHEYETNPNDVVTSEEMRAILNKLFKEAEAEFSNAA